MTVTYAYKITTEDQQSMPMLDIQRDSFQLVENKSVTLAGGGVQREFRDSASADAKYPTTYVVSWVPGVYDGEPNVRLRASLRTFQERLIDGETDSVKPIEVGVFVNAPGQSVEDPTGISSLILTAVRALWDFGNGATQFKRLANCNLSDLFD